MPRINLLPVRALARLERAKRELLVAAGVNLLLLLLLGAAWQLGAGRLATLAQAQAQAQGELDQLADQVQGIVVLKAKSAALATKLEAIDNLRVQKAGPAQLLAFLSDVLGELPRVWLTHVAQQAGVVTLEGGAMAQGDISAFQLALGERKPAFGGVDLTLVNTAHGEAADYLQWTLTCRAPNETKAAP